LRNAYHSLHTRSPRRRSCENRRGGAEGRERRREEENGEKEGETGTEGRNWGGVASPLDLVMTSLRDDGQVGWTDFPDFIIRYGYVYALKTENYAKRVFYRNVCECLSEYSGVGRLNLSTT